MRTFTAELAGTLAGPEWLVRRRMAAAERAADTALPSPEEEVWRYSPIADLDLDRYTLVTAPSGDSSDDLEGAHGQISNSGLALCRNGFLTGFTPAPEAVEAGVQIRQLGPDDEALAATVEVDVFATLNAAFAPAPLLVQVPAGVQLQAPIVVVHRVDAPGGAVFPRLIVDVGTDAAVEVLDWYGSPDVEAFVAPVVELRAAAAARLGYLGVQQLGRQVWHIGSQVSHVGSQAQVTSSVAALGGGYARQRMDTHLTGRGATSDLASLYFGDGKQILDFRTFQEHVAADTTSNLLFKGAVDDNSRSVYTGLIRVGADARGTNAFQSNRNIKLSSEAWAESVPNLEIENNQVQCSHASTVGPIDTDQLFYLESRGVPTAVGERLIVAGFFNEVLDRFPVSDAVPFVRGNLQTKLGAAA